MHSLMRLSYNVFQVLALMQKAILATDLVLFFRNKDQFSRIVNNGEFNWDVPQHKFVVTLFSCDHEHFYPMCAGNLFFV